MYDLFDVHNLIEAHPFPKQKYGEILLTNIYRFYVINVFVVVLYVYVSFVCLVAISKYIYKISYDETLIIYLRIKLYYLVDRR